MSLPEESAALQHFRQQCLKDEPNFRLNAQSYCVFHAESARKASADNYADMTLADTLVDLLKGQKSEAVNWQQIRHLWLQQLKELSSPSSVANFYKHMQLLLDQQLGIEQNLVHAIHLVTSQSLTPLVISGLSKAEQNILLTDQKDKLSLLLNTSAGPIPKWRHWLRHWRSARVGNVVRCQLKRRAKGLVPRQQDLLDPLVDMLPVLGIDRAVDSLVTVLTAIVGPPGAAVLAICYELQYRPDWFARIAAEMQQIPEHCLFAAPLKSGVDTQCFIKEILRLWNVPVVIRKARTTLQIGAEQLAKDSLFYLSPYLIHRNPNYWQNADQFQPERWLAQSGQSTPEPGTYVPFGWTPKACVGSLLGTIQLVLACRLLSQDYKLQLQEVEQPPMVFSAFPQPKSFVGQIQKRSGALK